MTTTKFAIILPEPLGTTQSPSSQHHGLLPENNQFTLVDGRNAYRLQGTMASQKQLNGKLLPQFGIGTEPKLRGFVLSSLVKSET